MASLVNFSMKNADGTYTRYTMSIYDKTDEYGNNAAIWFQQTKEERESKAPKKFVGNGKVQWTDGTIIQGTYVERAEKPLQSTSEKLRDTDLPF